MPISSWALISLVHVIFFFYLLHFFRRLSFIVIGRHTRVNRVNIKPTKWYWIKVKVGEKKLKQINLSRKKTVFYLPLTLTISLRTMKCCSQHPHSCAFWLYSDIALSIAHTVPCSPFSSLVFHSIFILLILHRLSHCCIKSVHYLFEESWRNAELPRTRIWCLLQWKSNC